MTPVPEFKVLSRRMGGVGQLGFLLVQIVAIQKFDTFFVYWCVWGHYLTMYP